MVCWLDYTVQQLRLLDVFSAQSPCVSQARAAIFTSDCCLAIHAKSTRVIVHYTVIVIRNTKTIDSTVCVLVERISEPWRIKSKLNRL